MSTGSKRGVWVAQYLIDGHPVAIAVDSERRIVGSIVLHPRLVPAEIKRYLAELLDTVDPVSLHLMADVGDAPVDVQPAARQADRKGH
jgi:hypothetical protein